MTLFESNTESNSKLNSKSNPELKSSYIYASNDWLGKLWYSMLSLISSALQFKLLEPENHFRKDGCFLEFEQISLPLSLSKLK